MSDYISSVFNWLRWPLGVGSFLAAALSGLLYVKQNEIIYPRNIPPDARTNVPSPSLFKMSNYEDFMIATPDGESLHAYHIRPENQQFARNITVLMFHGNAGNIGYRIPIARVLANDLGCNVYMVQYRGYGKSTGDPDEKGLKIDAQAALDYIRSKSEASTHKLVVYGQSLGGAVGIDLVAMNQEQGDIAGLILENTFTSIPKLIPSIIKPAKYLAPLCHQVWPSEEVLPRIRHVPILFLSGLQDEIVPPSHMRALFDSCETRVKVWRDFPRGTHNDTVGEDEYFQYVEDFLRDVVLAGRAAVESKPEHSTLKPEKL